VWSPPWQRARGEGSSSEGELATWRWRQLLILGGGGRLLLPRCIVLSACVLTLTQSTGTRFNFFLSNLEGIYSDSSLALLTRLCKLLFYCTCLIFYCFEIEM
jgi:hypothetical protein